MGAQTPSRETSSLDLRQHLALERTLLAYLRTGLAFIAVGFVIARFGLIVRELGLQDSAPHTHVLSLSLGSALVLLGGAIGPIAGSSYRRQVKRLNAAMNLQEKPVALATALGVILAFVGVSMTAYLIVSA